MSGCGDIRGFCAAPQDSATEHGRVSALRCIGAIDDGS
jgi:hypothetical protein